MARQLAGDLAWSSIARFYDNCKKKIPGKKAMEALVGLRCKGMSIKTGFPSLKNILILLNIKRQERLILENGGIFPEQIKCGQNR